MDLTKIPDHSFENRSNEEARSQCEQERENEKTDIEEDEEDGCPLCGEPDTAHSCDNCDRDVCQDCMNFETNLCDDCDN